jgi:uncharacterized membrane protein (UPF0127 family)
MPAERIAPRLDALPRRLVLGLEVPVAVGFRARLLGLARLNEDEAGPGLLIPRCSSVHTFGMRFPLDIVFLDELGKPLATRRNVAPRRLASLRDAAAVLEIPSGGGRVLPARDLDPCAIQSSRKERGTQTASDDRSGRAGD